MTVSIDQAGRHLEVGSSGVELLRLHEASLAIDLSGENPSLGVGKVIVIGSHAYVHLAALGTAKARRQHLKPWIVENVKAAAGYNPWSLGNLTSLAAIKDVVPAGVGNDAGMPVTRYAAKLDLRRVLALNPQVAKLFATIHVPKSLLGSVITARFDVGSDGYLHALSESFTLPVSGQPPLAFAIAETMSGFDEQRGPLAQPPSYDVMTLAQYELRAGARVPSIA